MHRMAKLSKKNRTMYKKTSCIATELTWLVYEHAWSMQYVKWNSYIKKRLNDF